MHQVGGRALLHHLAVQPQLDLDRVVRPGLVGGHERRPAGGGAVEGLPGHPLRRLELVVASGEVVEQHVARHVLQRVRLRHVLRARADHERHLGLVVHAPAPRRQCHGGPGRAQGIRELGEEGGRLRRLGALLLAVRAVVQPDADDLPGPPDRGQQLDALQRASPRAHPAERTVTEQLVDRPRPSLDGVDALVAEDSRARPPPSAS